jgi:SAM-dependent methyltransferase
MTQDPSKSDVTNAAQPTARNWDDGWADTGITLASKDVWLLTDHIKLSYLLPLLKHGMKTLEVGCGSAKLSALLAHHGMSTFGLDYSRHGIEAARANYAYIDKHGTFVCGNAFGLPIADEQFDAVLSTGLLEHFTDPTPVLAEMKRVLRPGGILFSDVAPLKFSTLRLGFYLRRQHRTVDDEYAFSQKDIEGWLDALDFKNRYVTPSGIVPPLALIRRLGFFRDWAFNHIDFWKSFDKSRYGRHLCFYYIAIATK